MKKRGILNGELMKEIALLAHKDLFMISDAGMPIPNGVKVIDIALCKDVPTFKQVFDEIIKETVIEHYCFAEEMIEQNEEIYKYIKNKELKVENEKMVHEDLKKYSRNCKFAIRTGECSPYANIILTSGVFF